jgi:hypothetical protein
MYHYEIENIRWDVYLLLPSDWCGFAGEIGFADFNSLLDIRNAGHVSEICRDGLGCLVTKPRQRRGSLNL